MIEIKNLTKYYGKILGVKDVNLEVKQGEIFGLLGPNGAGKSTMIKCIMQSINKNSGTIYINKQEVKKGHEKYKEDIGYLPSEVHLYDELKVKDMFKYSASFYKEDLTERIDYLTEKLQVPVDKKIEDLSFGNLKKVGIVLALMHNPKILVLDEPTSGLDPLITEEFFKLLTEEKEKGTTILFSTHILSEVKKVCDRIGIIKEGELIKVDNINSFLNNNFSIVTILGENFKKLKILMKDIIVQKETKDSIKFIYKGNINDLIKVISEVKINHLIIEEPDIEDIFINYYK